MEEFNKQLQKIGVENLRFIVPLRPIQTVFGYFAYTSSSDPEVPCICRIDESKFMDKLEDNYKVSLVSEDKRFGTKRFYISDLRQMVRDGRIRMLKELKID